MSFNTYFKNYDLNSNLIMFFSCYYDIPLYVTILSSIFIGISGDPQTMASNSLLVNIDNNGTGMTLAIPSRTIFTCSSNSCSLY